jgi:enoyl-CoA hydratase/carnithine racemase
MEKPLVLSEIRDHIAILTLNHPEKRNALSREMLTGLAAELKQIAKNSDVRVVVLRAEGPAFSAGHDLRELVDGNEEEYTSLFNLCTEVMEAIRNLPQPVIAQVHGIATAAGCQLVATCDLAVAAENATFATPGVKIGLFCSTPAVALARAVTSKRAMEMLLTGTPITAREAERIGLVNRVVPADRLAEETMKLAQQISAASPQTVALGKRTFYRQLPLDYPGAYEVAQEAMVENAQAPDAQEGMHAFLEKRPAKW